MSRLILHMLPTACIPVSFRPKPNRTEVFVLIFLAVFKLKQCIFPVPKVVLRGFPERWLGKATVLISNYYSKLLCTHPSVTSSENNLDEAGTPGTTTNPADSGAGGRRKFSFPVTRIRNDTHKCQRKRRETFQRPKVTSSNIPSRQPTYPPKVQHPFFPVCVHRRGLNL